MGTRSTPHGEIVAVTASGVNDDKVLRSADVGLTMVTTAIKFNHDNSSVVCFSVGHTLFNAFLSIHSRLLEISITH